MVVELDSADKWGLFAFRLAAPPAELVESHMGCGAAL
eukprot:gene20989-52467_t